MKAQELALIIRTEVSSLLSGPFGSIYKQFESIDRRFESIDKRFESIDRRFDSIDQKFVAIDKRFETIDKRFDSVEGNISKIRAEIVDLTFKVDASLKATSQTLKQEKVYRTHDKRISKLESDVRVIKLVVNKPK